jgi:predicted aspartyl protease
MSVNGHPVTYFFDTGAWVNCMSESEARSLGLKIHEGAGTLNTGTGVRVGFRSATAPTLTVGKTRFRNVSFAIFPDNQEPWSTLAEGRRGLIGMPAIQGLRSIRWTEDGAVEIGAPSSPADPARANLFFDNDHLVVSATIEQRVIHATLDTGAQTTDLYQAFATEFPALLDASGKRDSTEVRGVGHAETFDSVTLPELPIRLAGAATVLRPAHVLLQPLQAAGCIGNFGMDLLKQGRAFRIDLAAMRLEIEPE